MQLGDISVRFISLMLDTVAPMHPAPLDTLRRFGIEAEGLSTPDARVSIPRFMKLGHAFIEECGRPELGLLMGQRLRITDIGLPGYAVMTAPRLVNALWLNIHFEKLASENRRGSSRFYCEESRGIAEFYSISPYNEFNRFVVDCILSGWLTLARWLTGQSDLLEAVEIEFPPPDHADLYRPTFGCRVRFDSPRNALIFRPSALDLPVLYRQPSSHQAALALCNEALLAIRQSLPIEEKVRQLIMAQPQISGGRPEQLAQQLGMMPWTLKRQLARRGTSVSRLADEVRRELAETYLRSTGLSIAEIAFELGYSSLPAFFRSCRRWFGETPESIRRQ